LLNVMLAPTQYQLVKMEPRRIKREPASGEVIDLTGLRAPSPIRVGAAAGQVIDLTDD
jgi:hypothetical protein